jgi:CHAD domain-containing protein
MAYRLKRGEPVPEGIRRIAAEELADAARRLTAARPATRDEAIHEARKSVKKVRALSRLMRPELDGEYSRINRRLRNAGRQLSQLRDAGAIIETFDKLRKKYQDELGANSLLSIRRALAARKRQTGRSISVLEVLRQSAASITGIGKGVKKWQLHTDGFPALHPGLHETFRRARKAMSRAKKNPLPGNCHEWRKRVKDNWYQIRLLEDLWTDVIQADAIQTDVMHANAIQSDAKSLKDLETWLGDDHNLVVLHSQLTDSPEAFGKGGDLKILAGLIGKYQKELRENALSLGEQIYREKPRDYVRRMKELWDAWQTGPKSLEEQPKQERASGV